MSKPEGASQRVRNENPYDKKIQKAKERLGWLRLFAFGGLVASLLGLRLALSAPNTVEGNTEYELGKNALEVGGSIFIISGGLSFLTENTIRGNRQSQEKYGRTRERDDLTTELRGYEETNVLLGDKSDRL